jgi:aminopeptidase N
MRSHHIFIATAMTVLCPPISAQTVPGTGIDVQNYSLEVTPNFSEKSINVTAEIRFKSTQEGLAQLAFSPSALIIDEARIGSQVVRATLNSDALIFPLPRPMRNGAVATLTVRYHGQPKRGVVFDENKSLVYTGYFACDWLICAQDAPGDKATVSIDLILPKGQAAVAVGDRQSISQRGDGRERHRWRTRLPYSSYLIAFAAGAFNEVQDGEKLTYLTNIRDPDTIEKLFGTTYEMLAYFESKAGVALPSKRYTQVLIEGSVAQEAATYATIGREELDPILTNKTEDWVIAHELAHQWWGNLVTCKSWEHFWLNEGITTFMTAAWKEHKHGRPAYDAELDLARKRVARATQLGFNKPLAFSGAYPSLSVRRAIHYSKGALFMDHLRTLLGEKAFWAGLKRFTRHHAGGVVESQDLQRAFEQASGRDLTAPFKEWVWG